MKVLVIAFLSATITQAFAKDEKIFPQGFSMPLADPLYPTLPYNYPNVSMMVFQYETLPEVSKLLPPTLKLANPERPTAALAFATYPSSTIGSYQEVILYLDVIANDAKPDENTKVKPLKYCIILYVTTDVAMAAGRELAGFPKVMAEINFSNKGQYYNASARRKDLDVAAAQAEFEEDPFMSASDKLPVIASTYLTYRLIPSILPQDNRGGSLVSTTWKLSKFKFYRAINSEKIKLSLVKQGQLDKLVPIKELKSAVLVKADMSVDQDR